MLWDYANYSVRLELKLASEIAEKVDNVYLVATEIVVCIQEGGSESVRTIPCNQEQLIQLTKRSNYTHSFIHYKGKFDVRYISNLSITMKVAMIKRTLQVIDEVTVPPLALGNELGSLLTFEIGEQKSRFTDIKISITSTDESSSSPVIFFAHKAVLAARSLVFAKMFEHDLQESATNIVTVTDIDPEVFKELLTYIYTGKAPNIQTLASSLLNPAEKYQLGRLKALCERQMSYGLQVENAAETLVLAHTYGADQLKKNALKFIIKHRSEVRETKEWEKVHTMCDLLEDLLDTSLELAAKNKI